MFDLLDIKFVRKHHYEVNNITDFGKVLADIKFK